MTTRMKWAVGVAGLALIVAIAAFGFGGGSQDKNSSDNGYAEDNSEDSDDGAFNASGSDASQTTPSSETTLSEDIRAEIGASDPVVPLSDDEALTPGEGHTGQLEAVPEYDVTDNPQPGNAAGPKDDASSEQSADDPTQ